MTLTPVMSASSPAWALHAMACILRGRLDMPLRRPACGRAVPATSEPTIVSEPSRRRTSGKNRKNDLREYGPTTPRTRLDCGHVYSAETCGWAAHVDPASLEEVGRSRGVHDQRRQTPAATASSLARALVLARTPWSVPAHGQTGRPVASEREPLGHDDAEDDRAPHRQGASRDRRVHRGWSEPRNASDERLGRRRACMVAQPAGGSRGDSRSRRRAVPDHGSSGRGGRTGAPLATVARDRREPGRLCGAEVVADRSRSLRTSAHVRSLITGMSRPGRSRHLSGATGNRPPDLFHAMHTPDGPSRPALSRGSHPRLIVADRLTVQKPRGARHHASQCVRVDPSTSLPVRQCPGDREWLSCWLRRGTQRAPLAAGDARTADQPVDAPADPAHACGQ